MSCGLRVKLTKLDGVHVQTVRRSGLLHHLGIVNEHANLVYNRRTLVLLSTEGI